MSQFLYQKLDSVSELGLLNKDIPLLLSSNINPHFEIRPYQKEAFWRFFYYLKQYPNKPFPIHLMFNMATGSGKTFVMAGVILYLYEQWYRNFLFFVNSTTIIEKTKVNFLDSTSSKYLFADKIVINNTNVNIREVDNFSRQESDDICIKFTTIQWLHSDLTTPKENALTYEDFEDKKIVMLADEWHHLNAITSKKKLNKTEEEERNSREHTVLKILNAHRENLLLEFSATIDWMNEWIVEKYQDKILYRYDLKEFRLDGYSKEVDLLRSDNDQKLRMLQAIILSQYRLKVAQKYKIYCKPVILFKAQKTIAQSEDNLKFFNELIADLHESDIQTVRNLASDSIFEKVFQFFDEHKITDRDLVRELQNDFAENRCLSANSSQGVEDNQILLNTLEDKDNQIRAIFAVQKLNEWRDVLNLFDIVRLYDQRDGDWKDGEYKPWKTTIAEAQLVGRWARYFPFETQEALWLDRFKRKFDDTDHELKILETFYYHTTNDSKYVSEIKSALRKTGIIEETDKNTITVRLKDSFMKSDLYKKWYIYTNTRKEKSSDNIDSLDKLWIEPLSVEYEIKTGVVSTEWVFEDRQEAVVSSPSLSTAYTIKELPIHVVRKALWRNKFYTYNTLHRHLWKLSGMNEFMSSDSYLWWSKIIFKHSENRVITNDHIVGAVSRVLHKLESTIKEQDVHYEWTTEFTAHPLSKLIPKEKELSTHYELKQYTNEDRLSFEWFAWSSEEQNFIELMKTKIEWLQQDYDEVYIIRNERDFPIYSFKDGQRFEPDFLLYLKKHNSPGNITYQVFIEPKWEHLVLNDQWKEEFLLQIGTNAEILDMNLGNYRLVWLPFYNRNKEREFEEAMEEVL